MPPEAVAWTPLARRADRVPLVVAGPVVRRVDTAAATVWVALTAADTVTLTVFRGTTVVASNGGQPTVEVGERLHLLAATATVTGGPLEAGVGYSYLLEFASVDGAGPANFDAALGTGTLATLVYTGGAAGSEDVLPSFVLPPRELAGVRLVHTSCRKAHGESVDALPVLDSLLAAARRGTDDGGFAAARPHQLFLTGDQTYNDDVADAMLAMCTDAGGWLMGARTEPPPRTVGPLAPGPWAAGAWPDLSPELALPAGSSRPWAVDPGGAPPWPGVGERGTLSYAAGFTVTAPDRPLADELARRAAAGTPFPLRPVLGDGSPDRDVLDRYATARNQLMLLGEFYAMTLLSWSPVLWDQPRPGRPQPLPLLGDLTAPAWAAALPAGPARDRRVAADPDATRLRAFRAGLPAVRRALANVATYMMFDDHDVCDDWFINREWCTRVLGTTGDTLGRRLVRNALVSFALMQGWGNTPERFTARPGRPAPAGALLLTRLAAREEMGVDLTGGGTGPSVSALVGMPDPLDRPVPPRTSTALTRSPAALAWDFTWAPPGWAHEVLVLDCRTTRGYEAGGLDAPVLLDDGDGGVRASQLERQVPGPDHRLDDGIVTVLVVATPVLGERAIADLFQRRAGTHAVFAFDSESWSINDRAFHGLLARVVAHNPVSVILSGDVHYAMASAADVTARHPWGEPHPLPVARTGRVVQLTSSAARNENTETRVVHQLTRAVVALSDATRWCAHAPPGRVPRTGRGRWIHRVPRNLTPPVSLAPSVFTRAYGRSPDWAYTVTTADGIRSEPAPGPAPGPGPRVRTSGATNGDGPRWRTALRAVATPVRSRWHPPSGRHIVGVNNIGEVTFTGSTAADRHVVQTVHWRPDDPSGGGTAAGRTTTFDLALQHRPT